MGEEPLYEAPQNVQTQRMLHLAFSRRGYSMDYVGGVDSYTAFALG